MTKSTGKNKQRPLSRLEIDPIAGTIDRIMPDGEIRRDIGSNHSNGRYRVVVLNGIMHLNHRLIYWHFHGPIAPWMEIDHIEGFEVGDGIENLRWVTKSGNMQNLRKATAQNKTSGLLGVCFDGNRQKWKATITVNNKTINLGRYDTAEEAHAVYLKTKRELHPTCTI